MDRGKQIELNKYQRVKLIKALSVIKNNNLKKYLVTPQNFLTCILK